LFGLTTPHPETQAFFACLQVRILRVVFLQDLKTFWQDCLHVTAAKPVLVLMETFELLAAGVEAATDPEDAAADPDEAATDPDEAAAIG